MNNGSSLFLLISGMVFLLFFALPLLVCPLVWARRIGWKIPEETDLVVYLGRSLGAVALSMIITAFLAIKDPWQFRFFFDQMIMAMFFLFFVHVYGFIKRVQPFIEHVEIVFYGIMALLAWHLYPLPVP